MNGTSDFRECHALVKRIFDKDAPCLIEKCSLLAVLFPFFEPSELPSFPPALHQLHQVPFMEFISHASMKFHFWPLCLGLFRETVIMSSCHHGMT